MTTTNKFLKQYPQLGIPNVGNKVKIINFEGKYLFALADNINGKIVTIHTVDYSTMNIIVIIDSVKILIYRNEYRLIK